MASRSLGYSGDELQGQYRLPDGQQCMKWVQIANEGGLLPKADHPRQLRALAGQAQGVIVDFTRYQDGSPTKKGDVIYLVENVMKMMTGRMWDSGHPEATRPRP